MTNPGYEEGSMTKVMRETREAQARSARLKELESTIEKGASAVWDMAEALKEIRDNKLWRDTHNTWSAYCKDRWGIEMNWADRTIQALAVRRQLASSASTHRLPTHVGQADELARADEKDRPAVWQKAVERASGKAGPSAREVRAAVKEHKAAAAPGPPRPTRAELAQDAAREMGRAAEGFQLSVEALMPHVKYLPDDEAETCAYRVIQTVHAVIQILEEAGHLKPSVAHAVLASAPVGGEIIVS